MENFLGFRNTIPNTAAGVALYIGAMWSVSFLCHMYGMVFIGDIVGLLTIPAIYNTVVNYRMRIEDIPFGKCWRLTSSISIYASLITALVQYCYLRFLDNGRMVSKVTASMEMPEMQEMMKNMTPEMSVDEIIQVFGSLTVGGLTAQLLMMNLMLSLILSLIIAFFGSRKHLPKNGRDKGE